MLNKINVFPIVADHFNTFRDPRRGLVLKRDYLLFVFVPVALGVIMSSIGVRPSASFIDFLLLANTIFIPLMVNVLFVIYGVKERSSVAAATDEDRIKQEKSRRLLAVLYKNLIYAVVISCAALIALGATKLLDMPPPLAPAKLREFLVMARPGWAWFVYASALALTTHTALTVLMIVKRTHALLGDHAAAPK